MTNYVVDFFKTICSVGTRAPSEVQESLPCQFHPVWQRDFQICDLFLTCTFVKTNLRTHVRVHEATMDNSAPRIIERAFEASAEEFSDADDAWLSAHVPFAVKRMDDGSRPFDESHAHRTVGDTCQYSRLVPGRSCDCRTLVPGKLDSGMAHNAVEMPTAASRDACPGIAYYGADSQSVSYAATEQPGTLFTDTVPLGYGHEKLPDPSGEVKSVNTAARYPLCNGFPSSWNNCESLYEPYGPPAMEYEVDEGNDPSGVQGAALLYACGGDSSVMSEQNDVTVHGDGSASPASGPSAREARRMGVGHGTASRCYVTSTAPDMPGISYNSSLQRPPVYDELPFRPHKSKDDDPTLEDFQHFPVIYSPEATEDAWVVVTKKKTNTTKRRALQGEYNAQSTTVPLRTVKQDVTVSRLGVRVTPCQETSIIAREPNANVSRDSVLSSTNRITVGLCDAEKLGDENTNRDETFALPEADKLSQIDLADGSELPGAKSVNKISQMNTESVAVGIVSPVGTSTSSLSRKESRTSEMPLASVLSDAQSTLESPLAASTPFPLPPSSRSTKTTSPATSPTQALLPASQSPAASVYAASSPSALPPAKSSTKLFADEPLLALPSPSASQPLSLHPVEPSSASFPYSQLAALYPGDSQLSSSHPSKLSSASCSSSQLLALCPDAPRPSSNHPAKPSSLPSPDLQLPALPPSVTSQASLLATSSTPTSSLSSPSPRKLAPALPAATLSPSELLPVRTSPPALPLHALPTAEAHTASPMLPEFFLEDRVSSKSFLRAECSTAPLKARIRSMSPASEFPAAATLGQLHPPLRPLRLVPANAPPERQWKSLPATPRSPLLTSRSNSLQFKAETVTQCRGASRRRRDIPPQRAFSCMARQTTHCAPAVHRAASPLAVCKGPSRFTRCARTRSPDTNMVNTDMHNLRIHTSGGPCLSYSPPCTSSLLRPPARPLPRDATYAELSLTHPLNARQKHFAAQGGSSHSCMVARNTHVVQSSAAVGLGGKPTFGFLCEGSKPQRSANPQLSHPSRPTDKPARQIFARADPARARVERSGSPSKTPQLSHEHADRLLAAVRPAPLQAVEARKLIAMDSASPTLRFTQERDGASQALDSKPCARHFPMRHSADSFVLQRSGGNGNDVISQGEKLDAPLSAPIINLSTFSRAPNLDSTQSQENVKLPFCDSTSRIPSLVHPSSMSPSSSLLLEPNHSASCRNPLFRPCSSASSCDPLLQLGPASPSRDTKARAGATDNTLSSSLNLGMSIPCGNTQRAGPLVDQEPRKLDARSPLLKGKPATELLTVDYAVRLGGADENEAAMMRQTQPIAPWSPNVLASTPNGMTSSGLNALGASTSASGTRPKNAPARLGNTRIGARSQRSFRPAREHQNLEKNEV